MLNRHQKHPPATKHQPQRPPHLKIKRRYPEGRSQGRATNSPPRRHSPPKGRAVGKGVVLKSRSGNAGATPPTPDRPREGKAWQGNGSGDTGSPTPSPAAHGRPRRGFRGFPLHTHPRRLSPHPAARRTSRRGIPGKDDTARPCHRPRFFDRWTPSRVCGTSSQPIEPFGVPRPPHGPLNGYWATCEIGRPATPRRRPTKNTLVGTYLL